MRKNAVVTVDFYSTGARSYALTVAYPRGTANAKVAEAVVRAARDVWDLLTDLTEERMK